MSGETLLNNRYQLVAQQGSGGMAVIYKAVDQSLGRTVAIKILRPSLTPDPTFIMRFQNEARSIANLSHPNIVTVYDVGNDGDTHYIVMEFVDGRDLKKLIREYGGALPVSKALDLAIGICAGLGFAHRAELVHADVKPQNILLTKDEQVKITDFGIAQALSDSQPSTRQAIVWGSPHYFAPEQAQGERPSAASDVYSIGIVMFEMLTGRLPYTGANQQELAMAHIRAPIPRVTDINPVVPESLAQVVYKVMSKEPHNRYRFAEQLRHILESFRDQMKQQTLGDAAGSPRVVTPPPQQVPPPPAQLPQKKHPSSLPEQPPHIPPAPTTPPVQQGLPTQRYSAAPDAPAPVEYRPPRPDMPAPGDSRPTIPPPEQSRPLGMDVRDDSRPLAAHPYGRAAHERPGNDDSFQLDGATIALAVVAFMAVACLIPLYIAVLLANT
jgi:eukaryotic-like serine/threonine-protein kinase